MRTAGKTIVRNDALASIAQAVKPAQLAVVGLDSRTTGGSARRRVPPSSFPDTRR